MPRTFSKGFSADYKKGIAAEWLFGSGSLLHLRWALGRAVVATVKYPAGKS
jgi:hypothetical protein